MVIVLTGIAVILGLVEKDIVIVDNYVLEDSLMHSKLA